MIICFCEQCISNGVMTFFARHPVRRYGTVSAASVLCTLFVVNNLHTDIAVDQPTEVRQPYLKPPRPSPTPSASANTVTERARDWRRTNRIILEYNADVAQRLKKLAEYRTPADHTDTVRLARDLLDPPPDNPDGIKHARYIMKTPQAEKVDEITQNMACILSSLSSTGFCS